MSYSRKRAGRPRGSLLQGLTLVTLVGLIATALSSMTVFYSRVVKRKVQDMRAIVQTTSGIELVLFAYRNSELRYVKALGDASCDSGKPFLEALKRGSGCAAAPDITVFTTPDEGVDDNLYQLGSGCVVSSGGSTCNAGNLEIMAADMPGEVRAIATEPTTKYYLTSVNPEKEVVEFAAVTSTKNNRKAKFAFAIRGSLVNAAHLEVDGRVTQENPDPLAKCQGAAWATFLVFDPGTRRCRDYAQLGSGTGLAYYRGRYFGFRPFDGQFIDLERAGDATSTSYLIGPTGEVVDGADTVIGPRLFVGHDRDMLINVDDVTTVGDQLYYVADSSSAAHIGGLKPKTGGGYDRVRVCELGTMGWGQAYEGIAALGRSEPLFASAGDGLTSRIATFFLKTSGGDLLNAIVWQEAAGQPYRCFVMKDQNLQQVEYKRTYGFDRTDMSKPYYQY